MPWNADKDTQGHKKWRKMFLPCFELVLRKERVQGKTDKLLKTCNSLFLLLHFKADVTVNMWIFMLLPMVRNDHVLQ